jgi:RNA recognition motif-containing protein
VDKAIGRGPAALRDVLEKYPLLLANSDYFGYLRQAVRNLSPPKQKLMVEHITHVLNVTIVIKSIPVAVKKEQFVHIMSALALPLPETLSFQQDSGIFKGRAFARYTTAQEAGQALVGLHGFKIQGRTLRVESMNIAALAEAPFPSHPHTSRTWRRRSRGFRDECFQSHSSRV